MPNCVVVRGSSVCDVAAGRNRIGEICKTKFLFFLDDDTYPISSGVLDAAIQVMRTQFDVAILTFLCTEGDTVRLPIHFQTVSCSSMYGGASIVRVSAMLAVGGFNELLGYGCEDTEFAWNIIGNGLEVVRMPVAWIRHDHFASPRDHRWSERRYARNILLMHWIHFPFLVALCLALVRSCKRLLRSGHVGWYLAGMWDAFRIVVNGGAPRRVMGVSRWMRVLRTEGN
jgi:GT2 family glycosyltransferase